MATTEVPGASAPGQALLGCALSAGFGCAPAGASSAILGCWVFKCRVCQRVPLLMRRQRLSGSWLWEMLCRCLFRGWAGGGEWAQSDPWNVTLAGSGVRGCRLSRGGCPAGALPLPPSLPCFADELREAARGCTVPEAPAPGVLCASPQRGRAAAAGWLRAAPAPALDLALPLSNYVFNPGSMES